MHTHMENNEENESKNATHDLYQRGLLGDFWYTQIRKDTHMYMNLIIT